MRYVIVGSSFAGTFAVEAIRAVDATGEIIVIGDETTRLYSRALIHEYLAGRIDEGKLYLRDESFHSQMGVTLLAGRRAEKLIPESHELCVGSEKIAYDKLLIAAGAAPFIPPGIEGLDAFGDSLFTFTRFADAQRLAQAVSDATHAVVLGAGLIGMQATDGLAHLGKEVTVVELADQILPLACDEPAAKMIQTEMETHNVRFRTSDSVTHLTGHDGHLEAVTLRSGERLPADLFIVAVGVRPNVEWLRDSGLAIDRGIIVDERMRTNLDDVYAAGDCAQGLEMITGSRMILATIPIASEQGLVAGSNMAGVEAEYKGGIALNAMQFGRLPIISYGFVKEQPSHEVIRLLHENKRVYKKIVLDSGRIIGVVLVRAIDRAGLFRYLIEERIDVSTFKHDLIADDFSPATLPRDLRRRMFGLPAADTQAAQAVEMTY